MQFCPLHSEVLHLATWLRLELTLHAVAYLLQKSTTKTEPFKIIQTRPNPAKGETCCQNYSKLPGCHRPPWPRWHGALETSLLFNRQGPGLSEVGTFMEWIDVFCQKDRFIYDKFWACFCQGKKILRHLMSVWFESNVVEGMWGHRRTTAPAPALSCSDFTSRTLSAGNAWATLQGVKTKTQGSHHPTVSDKKNPPRSFCEQLKSFKIPQFSYHFPGGCLLFWSCGNLCLVFRRPLSFKSPATTRSLSIPQSFATASAAARWSPVHIHTSKSGRAMTMPFMNKSMKHWRGPG